MEFCSESLFLHLCLVQYCLCFSSLQLQCFRFQIEVFDLLGYNLYRVIEMDLLSFSCMWTSSFPRTIHSYATLSRVHFFFCLFIKYWVARPMSSHIWIFYCIPLVYMFDFVLVPHFSVTTGVFLLVWTNDSLRILLFFFPQDCLSGILSGFICILGFFFCKGLWYFDWDYIDSGNFYKISSPDPLTQNGFHFLGSQSFSSIIYNFHCRGLLSPSLSLFQDIFLPLILL